jgi:hypothetical protein
MGLAQPVAQDDSSFWVTPSQVHCQSEVHHLSVPNIARETVVGIRTTTETNILVSGIEGSYELQ